MINIIIGCYRIQIGETDSFITFIQSIISCLSIRITDFQHIQPFSGNLFHEWFLSQVPCTGDSREESETMVFVEILRTVVSEIKINKITIIPVIAETSGYSLITIRNTILQVCTYILSKNLRSLRILQYTSNMMSFESTTIVQFPFKELSLFSFRIGRLRHHFLVSDFREIQCSVRLTITVGLVSSRRFITFNPIGVIRIISESTYKTQSFGYKIQFLFQRKAGLNIILPTFIISGLCSHYPRIHIIILICPSRNFSI